MLTMFCTSKYFSVRYISLSVAVVVAFFVQWAPFHAQRLITSYVPTEMWTPSLIRFQTNLFYVSGTLDLFLLSLILSFTAHLLTFGNLHDQLKSYLVSASFLLNYKNNEA